jgi:lysozyme family protein
MYENVGFVLDRVFLSEGGYAERATEPGGAVNMGISFEQFSKWWYRTHIAGSKPTFEDLKVMPRSVAEDIYGTEFLSRVRFDVLPSGVDYAVADFAINSGVSGALNACRDALKIARPVASWHMDATLLNILRWRVREDVITSICDERWELMQSKPDFARIAKGRAKRMNAVWDGSRELAGLPPTQTRYRIPPT